MINFCYNRSRTAFNWLYPVQSKEQSSAAKQFASSVASCCDFVDLCALFGYYAEEHIVQTGDGYLLGLHRLGVKKGEHNHLRINDGEGSVTKPVVYLHHGLLMNSEVWVSLTDEERCLPFALVEKGYDVWVSSPGSFPPLNCLKAGTSADLSSLEIVEATSIPKNHRACLLPPMNFGISPLMNLPFMISPGLCPPFTVYVND